MYIILTYLYLIIITKYTLNLDILKYIYFNKCNTTNREINIHIKYGETSSSYVYSIYHSVLVNVTPSISVEKINIYPSLNHTRVKVFLV